MYTLCIYIYTNLQLDLNEIEIIDLNLIKNCFFTAIHVIYIAILLIC